MHFFNILFRYRYRIDVQRNGTSNQSGCGGKPHSPVLSSSQCFYPCANSLVPWSAPIQLTETLVEGGCIPEALVLQLIIKRLQSPDVQHYGTK